MTSDLIAQEIEEKYNDQMIKVSKEDKLYKIKKSAANTEKAQALESLKEFDKKVKDKRKKQRFIITLIHKKKLIKITN